MSSKETCIFCTELVDEFRFYKHYPICLKCYDSLVEHIMQKENLMTDEEYQERAEDYHRPG